MYNSYFGFREKPFNITPNPHFFYANQNYEEAYANLIYGIRERKGFMLLTGEVGTGKTTLLQKLMRELDGSVPFVFFYNTTLTFADLLSYVCDELSLKINGQGALGKIQALNDFLLGQLRQGSTAALLIDEAQNLREDVFENLRLLSNLETPREKLLQIVLSGQPELEIKLDRRQLRQVRQRISIQARLDRLSEKEVGAFIIHRVAIVGCKRHELFSRDAIKAIASYSKGIPRLVNIICDNALLIAYADRQKTISFEIVKEVALDLHLDSQVQSLSKNRLGLESAADLAATNGVRYSGPDSNAVVSANHGNASPENNGKRDPVIAPVMEASVKLAVPSVHSSDVDHDFLDALTSALTEAMGPMATLVIGEQLGALNSFPLTRKNAEKLVESVSCEVLDGLLKIQFKKKMVETANRLRIF